MTGVPIKRGIWTLRHRHTGRGLVTTEAEIGEMPTGFKPRKGKGYQEPEEPGRGRDGSPHRVPRGMWFC